MGRNFADVLLHGFRCFGKVDHHASAQVDGQAQGVLGDPGRGKEGHVFVRLQAGINLDELGAGDEVSVADHGSLGQPRGARGVAKDGQVLAATLVYGTFKEARLLGVQRPSKVLYCFKTDQPGVVIAPQPLVVPIDHTLDGGNLVLDLEQLVALFLVFGKDKHSV